MQPIQSSRFNARNGRHCFTVITQAASLAQDA